MAQRKKVIIGLRLEGVIGRRILSGVLDYLDTGVAWDIRFAYDVKELTRMAPGADGLLVDHMTDGLDFNGVIGPTTAVVHFHTRMQSAAEGLHAFVNADDGAIGFAAAKYLLELASFRSFGFIPAHGDRAWSDKRGRAFALYLRRHGQHCHSFRCVAGDTNDDVLHLSKWVKELPKPAALFAAWDVRAVETLEACRKAGVNVPRQAILLGVDNDEIICEHSTPPLSSIAPATEEEGFKGAQILDRLMRRGGSTCCRTILGSVKRIVERHSTRPPAPAAQLVTRALGFIKSDATRGIGPEDVARRVGVSRSLLDLRFRELGEKTLNAHIQDARLSALANELRRSRRPLAELTVECGFASVNSAKEMFRKRFGMTMRDYRKLHAKRIQTTCRTPC